MAKTGKEGAASLGELEELVLLSALRLGENAYGAALRKELKERADRAVSVSTIYVTLVRLEDKGLVASRLGAPTAQRGGKAKRLFSVTAEGATALEASRATRARMWEGLEQAAAEVRQTDA